MGRFENPLNSLNQEQLCQLKNRGLNLQGFAASPTSFSFLQPEVQKLTLLSSESLKSSNDRFTRLLIAEEDELPQYFKNLQSLTLESLNLRNVDGLGDISHIKLISCGNLVDITALGRNLRVEISHCHSLRDVSSLATVPVVTIKHCMNIED